MIAEPQEALSPAGAAATPLAGAIAGVFLARVAGAGAAFLGTVLLARHLGPASFGQFAILFALMNVVAEFARSALDTSVVRFAAHHTTRADQSLDFFRTVLRLKLLIALVVVVAGVLLARPLLLLLFPGPAGLKPAAVTMAFFGAAMMSLLGFVMAFFQAHQQFGRYALADLAHSGLRLLLVVGGILAVTGAGVTFFLGTYVAAPTVLALAGWCFLPGGLMRRPNDAARLRRELLHFAKWVLAASVFTSLAQRLDIFLLGIYRLPQESLGHYGAALTLVLIGDLVILTLYNVLLPHASQIQSPAAMRAFLHSFRWPSLAIGLAMTPLIVLAQPLVRLTFGDLYAETAGFFAVLLVGTLFSLGCAPAGVAVYGLGRPQVITVLEGIKLVLIAVGGVWAIPRYGALGMAWIVSLVKGIIGVATYVSVQRYISGVQET